MTEDIYPAGAGAVTAAGDDLRAPTSTERVHAEFDRAEATLAQIGKAVACYGSARTPEDDPMYACARKVGELLARKGVATITGGGPGIMAAASRGAFEAGGVSVGLCIELPFEEQSPWLTHAIAFRYLFVRKTMFERHADAAIVFPGGFGTFDELFELLTLIQTGKVHRRPLVLFGSSYWRGLLSWLKRPVLEAGMISANDLELVRITDDADEALRLAGV